MSALAFPLDPALAQQLTALNSTQLAWLSGYCWAQSQTGSPSLEAPVAISAARQITVLSASQTGNARRVAETLLLRLETLGLNARLSSVADYKSKTLSQEDIVVLVTSTQGEGEPPEEAIPLYQFLFGKKAPDLSQLSYAVLALGDSSYPDFCQAGKDFDERLAALGAQRLSPRRDCDLDHQADADAWCDGISQRLAELAPQTQDAPSGTAILATPSSLYSKAQPYHASLSVRQKITATGAGKDIQHLEIDLGDSGIQYQPGDALGVWPSNEPALVEAVLTATGLSGDEAVALADGQSLPLREALLHHDELTQNTPQFVKGYAELGQIEPLLAIATEPQALNAYLASTPIVAVLRAYPLGPQTLDAQALHGLLRPLTPRLYSIASAQAEVDNEVHLTVALERFEYEGESFTGTASGFLGQRLEEDDPVKVFIEPNPHFRLPSDPATDIIMIGAGTGVAPYRAFMQQREQDEASGKNWLVFGNQRFIDDFLYQAEWQQWHKQGRLHQVSLAWSRQNPQQKVYVQDRLRQEAAQLWQWLQNGAHVYVCGDANRMARDVEATLLNVIAEQGQLDADAAADYLNELREQGRYQRDVY
ncbi:MAG: assimilatory sulfite reductase (NADPH) flavoprotein subunit [Neisseriaceae bacterium]|nr:assimilatory sulfite reductase (NADPH) flavoprotein subunit [Neisseriaceae bacterium]